MSILFLSYQDFAIQDGARGKLLCHELQGFSLVFYYSTHCNFCQQILPMFMNLPNVTSGCQFAIINVSLNSHVINMSQQTIDPLEYVPTITFYINGMPYRHYNGAPDIREIQRFIVEISKDVNSAYIQNNSVLKPNRKIPEYTLGTPLCGDDERFYLEFVGAYKT